MTTPVNELVPDDDNVCGTEAEVPAGRSDHSVVIESECVQDKLVQLLYDPILDCYYDPKTATYYDLK